MESGGLRILITGASGFLGGHFLTRLKKSVADEIVPVARTKTDQIYGCDLCNKDEVFELLSTTKPSKIFHCAGSFTNEFEQDYKNNVLATYHLLQAIDDLEISCRILLIGSAAEYGIPESESGFISEDHPLKPVSVYGLSKVFQTQMMGYFQRKPGMNIVMARIFNLDGDGVSSLLFPGRVRSEIKDYLAKKTNTIQVGDLSAYRDYLPVNEAISDLISIMEHGGEGEVYNVGSGQAVQMNEYLKSRLANHNISMEVVKADGGLETKSSGVSVMAADLTKIRKLKTDYSQPRHHQ